jgi:glyoxylase-like metal-dependent hydrolase (beta-lactamase superfamily II)
MQRVADDVYLLRGIPEYGFNVYLVGDVLVDSATRWARWRILKQLRGRRVSAHVLTHAHPDHQGSSRAVCRSLGIPLWCGADDADAAEDPRLMQDRLPKHALTRLGPAWTGPGHPVSRRLREGDEVGEFTVLETPGHTAGHISLWRERDRVLILGDVLTHYNWVTGATGLTEPPVIFSADPLRNRQSACRIADLEPSVVCFGHGAPLRNPKLLQRRVERWRQTVAVMS